MSQWQPFHHAGQTYDLSHLDPKLYVFVQDAKDDLPEQRYEVQVIYSLHCFTHAAASGEDSTGPLAYSDIRETRIFDFPRYAHSHGLQAILEQLSKTKCFHTNRGTFFTVKQVSSAGVSEDYEVYFKASKSSVQGRINLYVQSAYVRDRFHDNKPIKKKINFFVILHNTLNSLVIKLPP